MANPWEVRLNWASILPDAQEAMVKLESVSHHAGLERRLLELVKIRVSQMNGCVYCLDMHTKDARANGEVEQRMYSLVAWRESPWYTAKERAALAWAEALTRIEQGVSDDVYEALKEYFDDRQIVGLTSAVITINSWNRWAISMKTEPGTYRPDLAK